MFRNWIRSFLTKTRRGLSIWMQLRNESNLWGLRAKGLRRFQATWSFLQPTWLTKGHSNKFNFKWGPGKSIKENATKCWSLETMRKFKQAKMRNWWSSSMKNRIKKADLGQGPPAKIVRNIVRGTWRSTFGQINKILRDGLPHLTE